MHFSFKNGPDLCRGLLVAVVVCNFLLTASAHDCPVAPFRVWGDGRSVSVRNLRTQQELALAQQESEEGGHVFWSGDACVEGLGFLAPGDLYSLVLRTSDGQQEELPDPRCPDLVWRRTVDGRGWQQYCLVPEPYTWQFLDPAKMLQEHRGLEWWANPRANAVVYQAHVATVSSEQDNSHGTFDSLIDSGRLDEIKDLGVNVLELLPVNEIPGSWGDGDDWGYGPASWFAVSSTLGGSRGLKRLVDEAARRGMVVGMDLVLNHSGCHRQEDNVVVIGAPTSEGDSPRCPTWHPSFWDGGASTAWGPGPGFGLAPVRSHLRDAVKIFREEYRVPYFRWDSIDSIVDEYRCGQVLGFYIYCAPEGRSFVQEINRYLHAGLPEPSVSVCEHKWTHTDDGDRSALGYDGKWDPGAALYDVQNEGHPALWAIAQKEGRELDLSGLVRQMTDDLGQGRVVMTEDHDLVSGQDGNWRQRVPTQVFMRVASGMQKPFPRGSAFPSQQWTQRTSPHWDLFVYRRTFLTFAAGLVSAGMPLLFQGQEHMEFTPFSHDDPNPPPLIAPENCGSAKVTKPDSLFHDVSLHCAAREQAKKLIRLRQDPVDGLQALRWGSSFTVQIAEDMDFPIVALLRRQMLGVDDNAGKDYALVLLNFGTEAVLEYAIDLRKVSAIAIGETLKKDTKWEVRFDSDKNPAGISEARPGDDPWRVFNRGCPQDVHGKQYIFQDGRGIVCVPPLAVLVLSMAAVVA